MQKKVTISDYSVVAGVGFIPPRCCGMGQWVEQPKETPIALPSDFFFCSQDDASITWPQNKNSLISQGVSL